MVLYGYEPRHFGISTEDMVSVPELSTWLHEKQLMTEVVKQHLAQAKDRMKKQVDLKRAERSFQSGDWVFLKARPYVQSSLAPRANQKLSFKFFGPYQVLSRIGNVAYKLQLPASSLVHPVFHVSQLKPVVGNHQEVTADLPDPMFQWSIPEKLLAHRVISRGVRQISQVLVKWSHAPSLATWEDLEAVKQQFPMAAVWGQPASQEGGSVSRLTTQANGPRKSTRPRKANVCVTGPEWK
jgi:hypothetical protein